jgi:multidrug efflux pump subunit AcrA (membrane-fusion protein)
MQSILRNLWFRIAVAVVAVSLVGWRIAASNAGSFDIPTADVQHGELTLTLSEVGELKATRSATVSAPNDKLITYLVPEGSWVKQGDLLVQLESAKYKIGITEQQSALDRQAAQLRRAQADLDAQRYKEQAAKKAYESLLELKNKGFAMDSEVEEARLTYMELKSQTGGYEAAVQQEVSGVDFARGGLDQIKLKLAANAVYAPMEGLVVYATVGRPEDGKKVELGMTPYEGQPLMYLPDIKSMQVETQVNEMDVQKVRVGQPVSISLDAVPDVTFKGKVARVGSLAQHKVSKVSGKRTGVKVFDVIVDVEDADPRLRPGLSANASVLLDELQDVTYVPVEAVFNEEGRTVAYVRRGRGTRKQVVDCGPSNDRFVVIRSGLKVGDKVCLAQPS